LGKKRDCLYFLYFFRHFNDRAVYTCDDGYQIVGMDKVTCNSNGQWNGVTPSCKKATSTAQSRYYCGTPPEMPNAKHNGTKEQVSFFKALFCEKIVSL
jgi:hypothetical protein